MRQQLRLRVLLPLGVLGLLGAGFGAYAFGQAPEPAASTLPPTTTAAAPGGSATVPAAEWANAANAVCRKAEKAYADVPRPTRVAQFEPYLAKVVEVSESAAAELARLGRPQGSGGALKALATNSAARSRLAGRALAAVRSGDGATFRRSLARVARLEDEWADLMYRLGAMTCTEASRIAPAPGPASGSGKDAPTQASEASLKRELLEHAAVVVVFYTPEAGLDGTTVLEARSAALEVDAGFLAVDAGKDKQVSTLAQAYEVTEAPAVLVFVPGPKVAARFDRFADRETIAQAVQNAVR